MSLERYAEVLAHVRHFGVAAAPELVARLGTTLAVVAASEAHWTARIVEGIRAEDGALSAAFSTHYADVRSRLRAEKPTLASIGVAAIPGEVSPAPTATAPVLTIDSTPTKVELPTFMLPKETQVAVEAGLSTPPADLDATMPIATKSVVAALPFAASASPSPLAVPSASKPAPKPIDVRDETVVIRRALDSKPALPFEGAAASPPVSESTSGPISSISMVPPHLTLEQYASLCAELAVAREPRPVVLRKYRMASEEARKLEDLRWANAMRAKEQLRAQYNQLFTKFRAHLEVTRGG